MSMFEPLRLTRPLQGVRLVEPDELLAEEARAAEAAVWKERMEQVRDEAYAAGHRDASAAQEEKLQDVLSRWESFFNNLQAAEADLSHQLIEALPGLTLAAIQQIWNSWTPDESQIKGLLKDFLQNLDPETNPLRLLISPADKRVWESLRQEMGDRFPDMEWVVIPSYQPGECSAEGRFGTTDGRFSAKLKNLREALQ